MRLPDAGEKTHLAGAAAKIAVIYASRGRPCVLAEAIAALASQSRQPDQIIVSCTGAADLGVIRPDARMTILTGSSGMTAQRNRGLRAMAPDIDIVVFFDDDFLPRADWLDVVASMFSHHPNVGSVTGHVVADGVKGPGLTFDTARSLLDRYRPAPDWVRDGAIPYGCNMAFRRSAIQNLWFDERLVSYGWLEDRDFGAALEQRGFRIVKIGGAVGVHLGVKAGRSPGRQLGYSQIVNPIYLHRKGTMPLRAVADHLFRNSSSNLARFLLPEPHIDRRGRLLGNLSGLRDMIRGHLSPERAATL